MKLLSAALAVMALAGMSGILAGAEGPAASRPADEVAKFNDPVLDGALAKLSRQTELAVVQLQNFKELAAKSAGQNKDRERLCSAIVEILYPDQVEPFQQAYEELLGSPAGTIRKWSRHRLSLIVNQIEIALPQRLELLAALEKYFAQVQPEDAKLEAAYKDRLSEKQAAAEYQQKHEALWKDARAKSLEVVVGLLNPEQQKAQAAEWKRRQERRAYMTLKGILPQYAATTPEQKKQVDALAAAFRELSLKLDLESPEYGAATVKLEKDLAAVPGSPKSS